MPNSLYHCETCVFRHLSPAPTRFVLAAEGKLVQDHIHMENDERRRHEISEFENAITSRVSPERIEAARKCAQAFLNGECEFSESKGE